MKLLIVRHADAGDASDFAKTGKSDDQRPLSEKGRRQMRNAAAGLLNLFPSADLLVTSPYVRAMQTAEIVLAAYGKLPREVSDALEPEREPAELADWLASQEGHENVIVVGHEPHLSALASWLMCGSDASRIEMKKGGACLLVFDRQIRKGEGTLRWLMGPKHLGDLG